MPHPADITTNDVRVHIDALLSDVSPKTVAGVQLGLRRFFRFLVAEREIEHDPTAGMKLIKYRVTPQPTYSTPEVAQLLANCDQSTPNGVRDAAMITVLFDTGVRVGELVSMGVPNWDSRTVIVDGKTGIRIVPLGDTSLLATQRYVRRWQIKNEGLWQGRKSTLTVIWCHPGRKTLVRSFWGAL